MAATKDERLKVLQMLEAGTISPEEASELLSLLDDAEDTFETAEALGVVDDEMIRTYYPTGELMSEQDKEGNKLLREFYKSGAVMTEYLR